MSRNLQNALTALSGSLEFVWIHTCESRSLAKALKAMYSVINQSQDFLQIHRMSVTGLVFFHLVHFCRIKLCEKLLALRDEDFNGLSNQDISREDPRGLNWD